MKGAVAVSKLSDAERRYLAEAQVLGRLVTVQPDGELHVVPVGWRFDGDSETLEVSGRDFARTKKFRNVGADGRVAFIVDEVLPPWQPRAVMVQGRGRPVERPDGGALIRIEPLNVVSWGLG